MSLNPFDAFPMADMILRHGACMAMDAAEKGLSLDCQEISEFPAHAVFHRVIVLLEQLRLHCSADEGPEQEVSSRRPAGIFYAAEGAGDDTSRLGGRNDKTEAVNSTGEIAQAISQAHCAGG